MRSPVVVALAAVLVIAFAQGMRCLAKSERAEAAAEQPYAPSPEAARIVSLGYRETMADLLFFRLVGYFGGSDHTAAGVAGLVEAIVATDPGYRKVYEWGSRAIVASRKGKDKDNAISLRAIRLLEAGTERFPDDYKIPRLAGEMYLFDLQTKDEALRREWNGKAARLLETAVRRPNAPAEASTLAAHLRSKLGQHQRAIDNLREMMLITDDDSARNQIAQKLAELEHADAGEIAAELIEARKRFDAAWKRERPSMRPSMYLLIGPKLRAGFDLGALATGGDIVDVATFEHLEPPRDP